MVALTEIGFLLSIWIGFDLVDDLVLLLGTDHGRGRDHWSE
jgi:hypothetical protein